MSEGQALSEVLLKYVPRGGRGEFPVTTAINIAHDRREKEVDRKLNAHMVGREFYADLVTLEGELRLWNFGKTPAGGRSGSYPGPPKNSRHGSRSRIQ